MITPKFRCYEDENGFIVVEINLSTLCRLADAQFDIVGHQFTFYCRPYYLRLTFSHQLTEGAGEKASYDLATNVLKVQLPKADKDQKFNDLENPHVLLATARQRVQLMKSIPADGNEGAGVSADEEGAAPQDDEEFLQEMENATDAIASEVNPDCCYGFNSDFNGHFNKAHMDADLVKEIVDCPEPEKHTAEQRLAMCIADEEEKFEEDRVFWALEDQEGENAQVLQFRASYIVEFEKALRDNGVGFVQPSTIAAAARQDAQQEQQQRRPIMTPGDIGRVYQLPQDGEEDTPQTLGDNEQHVVAWEGNIAAMDEASVTEQRPRQLQRDEVGPGVVVQPATSKPVSAKDIFSPVVPSGDDAEELEELRVPNKDGATAPPPPPVDRRQLAMPKIKPMLTFTFDENDALARIAPKQYIITSKKKHVDCLLVDLLLAYCYDQITTAGTGSSESCWTMTKLSRTLSWLVVHDNMYSVVIGFLRRGLIFPYHCHFGLLQKCIADVGVLLLLGPRHVLRALLSMKHVLDHAEAKHVLSTVYMKPLIAHITQCCRTPEGRTQLERSFEALAVELHSVVMGEAKKPQRLEPASDAGPSWGRIVDGGAGGDQGGCYEAPCLGNLGLPFNME